MLAQLFDGALDDLPARPDPGGASPDVSGKARAVCIALRESRADDVLADHTRLFVNGRGGVAAPPYASWYLDRQLLGPSSRWVEQAYARQGLERAPDAGEPADYLGAELEFLFFLARHELAARSTADHDALRAVLDSERQFVLGHMARWVPAFISRIRSAEPGPVFAAATDLLSAVVEQEVKRLSNDTSKPMATLERA